jgi:hypothetical protein
MYAASQTSDTQPQSKGNTMEKVMSKEEFDRVMLDADAAIEKAAAARDARAQQLLLDEQALQEQRERHEIRLATQRRNLARVTRLKARQLIKNDSVFLEGHEAERAELIDELEELGEDVSAFCPAPVRQEPPVVAAAPAALPVQPEPLVVPTSVEPPPVVTQVVQPAVVEPAVIVEEPIFLDPQTQPVEPQPASDIIVTSRGARLIRRGRRYVSVVRSWTTWQVVTALVGGIVLLIVALATANPLLQWSHIAYVRVPLKVIWDVALTLLGFAVFGLVYGSVANAVQESRE